MNIAIFSEVTLVSNYPGCNRETLNLIPYYLIQDRYYIQNCNTIMHLEKLQIIQNINNLMFQIIFIFSD